MGSIVKQNGTMIFHGHGCVFLSHNGLNEDETIPPPKMESDDSRPAVYDGPRSAVCGTIPTFTDVLSGDALVGGAGDPPPRHSNLASIVEQCKSVITNSFHEGNGVLCVPVSSDGTPNGKGIRLHPNGNCLEGHFESLRDITEAKLSTPYDAYYMKGSIVQGTLEGAVELSLPDVGRFVGTLCRGKPHGMGVWARADGTWYEGAWEGGERHGTGTEHYSENTSYTGEWCHDLYDGCGEVSSVNGERFRGTWRRGTRVGSGTLAGDYTMSQSFHVTYDNEGNEVTRVTTEMMEIERLRCEVAELKRAAADAPPPSPSAATASGRNENVQMPGQRWDDEGEDGGVSCATLCKVCFVQPISRVLRPCNHACLCAGCEEKMRRTQDQTTIIARFGRIRCPICRTSARNSEAIILA